MNPQNPLLTICVPTYNRSNFLKLMLQALLPQAARHHETVEVLILDNASPDDTPHIVEQAKSLGPFRCVRNSDNIGPVANIVQGARDHACGEYVWILGDHNLMAAGVLGHVVETVGKQNQLDLFYVNYRCATYPDQWPESAVGGYDGPCDCVANEDTTDRHVQEWHELLNAKSALCTQLYAHIVRTEIWQNYWAGKKNIGSHQDGPTTYPHTYMIADTSFRKPAYYIGDPAVTIFNGAQSWADIETQYRVYRDGLPELLRLFDKRGLSKNRRKEITKVFAARQLQNVTLTGLRTGQLKPAGIMFRLIPRVLRDRWLLGPTVRAYVNSERGAVASIIKATLDAFKRRHQSWLYNCRPVRWVRSLSNK